MLLLGKRVYILTDVSATVLNIKSERVAAPSYLRNRFLMKERRLNRSDFI